MTFLLPQLSNCSLWCGAVLLFDDRHRDTPTFHPSSFFGQAATSVVPAQR